MRYWKITMDNGFSNCKEVKLEKTADNEDLTYYDNEYLQEYSFYEPDSRFIGEEEDYETEEDYQEEYDYYMDGLCVDVEELTYEEYLQECDNEGVEP